MEWKKGGCWSHLFQMETILQNIYTTEMQRKHQAERSKLSTLQLVIKM